jgi:tRNA modification GTPase
MAGFTLKDYQRKDTIAAIATFPGACALGVIKVSGALAIAITAKIFKPFKKKDIRRVKTFTIHYGWIVERVKDKEKRVKPQYAIRNTRYGKNSDSIVIDEVLVSIMRKPASYTTEDVVEISCHGGVVVLNKILQLLIAGGARLALPGEFTYRALLGGRIDALQAQSIAGIIEAKTDEALSLSCRQLQGKSAGAFDQAKKLLKDILVETESVLNFPEDDVPYSRKKLISQTKKALTVIEALIEGSREAKILREGLRCVICGKTNVGKSTLFNRLLNEERVIVSNIHGTTRDVVEEVINIRGVGLRIYDTAGILEAKDLLSRKAVERTHEVFDSADLIILVLDSSRRLSKNDLLLLKKTKSKNTIIVLNKIDLSTKCRVKDVAGFASTVVKMSALNNIGLADFEKAVYDNVYKIKIDRHDLVFLNAFGRKVLKEVEADLKEACQLLESGHTVDFTAILFKECLNRIGKITGEVYCQEILESIFSQFCIGK